MKIDWGRLLCLSLTVIFGSPSDALAQEEPIPLYQYSGTLLHDSQWGPLAILQSVLNKALTNCGQQGLEPDGKFGKGTRLALRRLATCDGFTGEEIAADQRFDGIVTDRLWRRLVGDVLPTDRQRALVIWLTHEATDYDVIEWNFTTAGLPQPNDPDSLLTWGPYGATIGHGGEVQAILNRNQELTRRCFGERADMMLGLAELSDGERRAAVKSAFLDPAAKAAWKVGFACFGADPAGRDAYDGYAFDTDKWFGPGITRLMSLLPSEQAATPVDRAFFADLAMHMAITSSRIATVSAALKEATERKGTDLTPAERRRVISLTLIPSNQQLDRKGRNVVYYVDAVGNDPLDDSEREAWRHRSGLKASMAGLTDGAS